MIVVSYGSRQLADQCTKLEVAQERFGPTDAQALVDLMAELEAFENVADMISFREAAVESDRLTVAFSPKFQAVFKSVDPKVARDVNDRPSWEQVRRILLVDIKEL